MIKEEYLKRLNYNGEINPDLKLFKTLHKSHLLNIPFENLDIHTDKKIILSESHLSDKILKRNRGGYCYELNGMFYLLLKELGFNVKMLSARVNNGNSDWGMEYDHLTLLVELDDLWLADVGFGDNFLEPILINEIKPQQNINGWYLISDYDNYYLKLSKSSVNDVYTDEYIFTLTERKWNEFEGMNLYHQTSADSHFTKNKLCTKATDTGRITLTDKKLTITENGNKTINEIMGVEDFNKKLKRFFNIRL